LATGDATQVAAAGRPQPQTTGEPAGGPFIRHSAPGRRPIYSSAATYGLYFGPKMVAAPGWYRGYKLKFVNTTGGGTGGVISALAGGQDAPYSIVSQLQCKDAYGTNLFARSVESLPSWTGITAASGAFTFLSYLPFEFTQAYGVIAAANAALLPDLQMPISTLSTLFSTSPSVSPTLVVQNDADFYWLPNVPTDPPGQGTTLQCIYQPCNPPVPSAGSLRVQLPRLGGYLAWLGFDLRDSTGARVDAFPARPGIFVDSVELINSDIAEIYDDMAINFGIGGGAYGGAANGYSQTAAATAIMNPRPTGIIAISRKTSLAQRDFGLLDTGEKFLSSNPGTQVEINGVPWGTISNTPGNLSAIIGQIVPSGRLIQGLPEV
jgi:hypothetical protein